MKQTQLNRIKEQINSYGYVSRNWAVNLPYKEKILRLGSHINTLNKQGYNLTGKYKDGDYIYRNEKPKLPYPFKEKKETYEQKEKLL